MNACKGAFGGQCSMALSSSGVSFVLTKPLSCQVFFPMFICVCFLCGYSHLRTSSIQMQLKVLCGGKEPPGHAVCNLANLVFCRAGRVRFMVIPGDPC